MISSRPTGRAHVPFLPLTPTRVTLEAAAFLRSFEGAREVRPTGRSLTGTVARQLDYVDLFLHLDFDALAARMLRAGVRSSEMDRDMADMYLDEAQAHFAHDAATEIEDAVADRHPELVAPVTVYYESPVTPDIRARFHEDLRDTLDVHWARSGVAADVAGEYAAACFEAGMTGFEITAYWHSDIPLEFALS